MTNESPMIWTRQRDGTYTCVACGLAIERSRDEGWWYVRSVADDGSPDPDRDTLGWARTLREAKDIAARAGRSK